MNTKISEEFLHYIWRIKKFDLSNLCLTSGQTLEILNYGQHNTNAGPDFLNASIRLDGTIWHGHIEIHVNSSDWYRHQHSDDPAYHNVILHVVLHHDKTILIGENPIPTLSLNSRIKPSIYNTYKILVNNSNWVPCQSWLPSINKISISSTIDKVLAERLTQKANGIIEELKNQNSNWQEIIYQRIFWAFGLSVNADAFLQLSRLMPYKIIAKHRDSLRVIESLLFGTAGLLDQSEHDDYINTLRKHYQFYKNKYALTQMRPVEWKFMRMRPSGFPTIRIAQLALFLSSVSRFDSLIFNDDHKSIHKNLNIIIDTGFWYNHYKFDTPSKPIKKSVGQQKLHSILINAISPLQYAYGQYHQIEKYKNQAIAMLESLPSETNSVIKKWQSLDVSPDNAASSQALLHLKKNYCDTRKCLQCPIGHQVFKEVERG